MTKKDFFILLIKVFGLYALITNLFSVFPSYIGLTLGDSDLFSNIWIFGATLILIGFFLLLVFESEKIVRLLKLDQGFQDDHIDLGQLNADSIIQLGCFIIGGMSIIHHLPSFLTAMLYLLKDEMRGEEFYHDNSGWIVDGINLLLGYWLCTNLGTVAKWLNPKTKE